MFHYGASTHKVDISEMAVLLKGPFAEEHSNIYYSNILFDTLRINEYLRCTAVYNNYVRNV